MMPNSTTRFVEPISKAIAAVKSAPLRNSDLAKATAAYEHDEEAAPESRRDGQGAGPRRHPAVRRWWTDARRPAPLPTG